MNIRFVQTNLSKLHDDNILKFLFDVTMNSLQDVDPYEDGKIYNKGDRVYLQENNIHQIFQCIIDESSSTFIQEEWEYILNLYNGEVGTTCNLKLKEEVHVIDENTVNSIVTNLEFKQENSTFAIFCGKKRYTVNYDFIVKDKTIEFKEPFNVGDRIILEVRETIGTADRLVLRNDLGQNYEICAINNDVFTVETDRQYFKTEVFIRDIVTDTNYKIYMIGEDLFYEPTDINVSKTAIAILDENEDKYNLEMVDGDLTFSPLE